MESASQRFIRYFLIFLSATFSFQFIFFTSVALLYFLVIKSPNIPVSMQNGYLECLNKEQETALQTLHRFSNEAIQGLLIYARSTDSPPQDQLRTPHCQDVLAKEELDAIWILRNCPDDLISARVNPKYDSQNGLSNSNRPPRIISWCTYCSPPRPFKTKDGWARHERETHEEHVYPCMLNGAIETMEHGPICAICKTIDPDDIHLDKHNRGLCSFSTKRRVDLVNHLKVRHGVSNGKRLAEDWKRAPGKKAWACGFCVKCFSQSMDRINHIYAEHYAQRADMHSWDAVKVIQGLLRQPRLLDTWSDYLRARCSSSSSTPELTWNDSIVTSLQKRLEMGEESPEILVAAAYDQSNLSPDVSGREPMSSSVDKVVDLTAVDITPYQFPQTSVTPPSPSYSCDRSDTPHEPGSDTEMTEFSIVDDSYLDAESMERPIQTFEDDIYQPSWRLTQRLNDDPPLGDFRMDDGGFPGLEFLDEAYGDANA